MSILVANCPRCDAEHITFDVQQALFIDIRHQWQRWYELFAVCRNCHRSTTFIVSQKDYNLDKFFNEPQALVDFSNSLNDLVNIEGYISLRHQASQAPPEHVPEDIAAAFNEAATCLAVECWNAAAAMFRLCIDLTTRPMLPAAETPGLNSKIRRDLGLRLHWLFEVGRLPRDLQELSACIREDGNDGAHAGTLKAEDAEDLLDFTAALLERIYTEPQRLQLAEERRKERRRPKDKT